jgi:hypothetical protein
MDTPGSPLHQLRTLSPRITHLGGSACHGRRCAPACSPCLPGKRGRRGRRRRGRRPGAPRRARRPRNALEPPTTATAAPAARCTPRPPLPRARLRTFAAARATALVERIRSYKLVRDIRDLLAADQLETPTYDLLARAAERAGDPDTANLGSSGRERAHCGPTASPQNSTPRWRSRFSPSDRIARRRLRC